MSTPVANIDGDHPLTKLSNGMSALQSGGAFERSSPATPFRDWSYVFVPHCTFSAGADAGVVPFEANRR